MNMTSVKLPLWLRFILITGLAVLAAGVGTPSGALPRYAPAPASSDIDCRSSRRTLECG